MQFDFQGLIDPVLILDEEKFYSTWEALKKKAAAQQIELDKAAGFSVNSGSRKDLEVLLIEKLGFEPQFSKAKTKSNRKRRPSFSKEVLATYDHSIVERISDLRSLLAVDKAFRFTQPTITEGLIHYELQAESVTGRLYGKNPPAHALPGEIRECIIPEPGYSFINGDFKSQELCIIAHICGCQKLLDDIRLGVDVMGELAYEGFERDKVKVAIYAYMYGSTPDHMSYNLSLPVEKINEFLDRLFIMYPEIRKWLDVREQVSQQGWAETIFGDRYTLDRSNPDQEEETRRGLNFIAQGSAAGVLYRTMQAVAEYQHFRVKVATFDALLIQCPSENVLDYVTEVKNIFDNILPGVLEAKVTHGSNWREAWKPEETEVSAA